MKRSERKEWKKGGEAANQGQRADQGGVEGAGFSGGADISLVRPDSRSLAAASLRLPFVKTRKNNPRANKNSRTANKTKH